MRPLVSVVVPAFNASHTIGACLSALRSPSPDPGYEVIVVDNGSTDDTCRIVRSFSEVRLLHCNDVRGPGAARNVGARAARGVVLAFTDADCVPVPSWVAQGLHALTHPDICGVAGRITGVPPRNGIQQWMIARDMLAAEPPLRHPFRPFIQTANAFYQRSDFEAVGGFDERLLTGEDCDLSWRVLEFAGGRFAYEPSASVAHDHRSTLRGLFRQSVNNARADAWLAQKWGAALPPKSWKTSVWELGDLVSSFAVAAGQVLAGRPRGALPAFLDFVHRLGRKWGMLSGACSTGMWGRW